MTSRYVFKVFRRKVEQLKSKHFVFPMFVVLAHDQIIMYVKNKQNFVIFIEINNQQDTERIINIISYFSAYKSRKI